MSGDVYVLGVSIVTLYTNLLLDLGIVRTVCYALFLGNVLTVCYALFFILFQQLQSHHQVICM